MKINNINFNELEKVFTDLSTGKISVKNALNYFRQEENIGFARIDLDRERRCGFPEVIFAQNKTPENALLISKTLVEKNGYAFLTRVPEATKKLLCKEWEEHNYHKDAKTLIIGKIPPRQISKHKIMIISAGTSDIPVAEEAKVTAEIMGCNVDIVHDCGVAGLHRLLAIEEKLHNASVIIVIAGMEGALPSVVGGLVDAPVIAVPTSVGYGASFGGIAALLGMLNSCASGVGVVNIDNGFGAGCLAAKMIMKIGDNNV